jgi:uncharacterized protein (TIGR03437 family)
MRLPITRFVLVALLLCLAPLAWSATFGTVVPIGGHIADLVLDEGRGVLYASNFTANRVEVISTTDSTRGRPIYLAAQPGPLALSPDHRYLVVGHYATWDPPATIEPSITIVDLNSSTKRNLAVGGSPLAIAFGNSPRAIVATTIGFFLVDPASGALQRIDPQGLDTLPLPVPLVTFPPEILQASAGVSGDGSVIYLVATTGKAECEPLGEDDPCAEEPEPGEEPPPEEVPENIVLRFDTTTGAFYAIGITSSPALGPRVVSVDQTGANALIGWGIFNSRAILMAQFPRPLGEFEEGSHAWDSSRDLIYGHAPTPDDGAPELTIFDADNLTVRERLRLPEKLAGKSVLNSDMSVMYAASDSGVTVLPIGSLAQQHRVATVQEDLVFRSNSCDRRQIIAELDIVDPGGNATDFSLSTTAPGVVIAPANGVTPARVRIAVDPTIYQNQRGTTAVPLEIASRQAINVPIPVRLLINTREPDQRGAFFDVPGKLVDLMADPVRNRFYVIRQDKNLVLVFDGTSFGLIGTMRTGNTPLHMAMTRDNRWLIITNDNSQIANVYDLDSLQPIEPIVFPPGHYPRTVAVSLKAILATTRSTAGPHTIDRVDFDARTASSPPSLGIYRNDINLDTALTTSPTGEYVLAASANGNLLLYEATADTFVVSRKDHDELSGALAAVSDQMYVVGNNVVNWSLVPQTELESGTGASSGFAFVDGLGLRTTSPAINGPGVIQRVDLNSFESIRPTRMVESPLLSSEMVTPPVGQIGQSILPFPRTLAALPNRQSIISLSVSGFTVLPWDFDAATAIPLVSQIVNSADLSTAVAPGGLVTITGRDMSTVTVVNNELPVPTTLGEVCVTVNDRAMPLLMVSPGQINGQLPFSISGNANLVVRASGGISEPFSLTILPGAAAIFRTGTAGPDTGLATVVRSTNNELVTLTNPIHPNDVIVIYATGLGDTTPVIEAGDPGPSDPLAAASLSPQVTLGGVQLTVGYAGLVPGQVGVYQINAFVPETVPDGISVPLTVTQGSYSTTLSVRVVKP